MALTRYIFPKGILSIGNGDQDLGADTLKVMLVSGYTFDSVHEIYTDVSCSEITADGGYTTGGFEIANTTWSISGSNVILDGDDVSEVTSSAAFPAFDGYIVYNETQDKLLLYVDLGTAYDPGGSEQIIIPFGANGILNWIAS